MIPQIPSNTLIRRAGFVAGHLLIIFVVYWLWIIPVQDLFASRNDQIGTQSALLARLESVAAQEDAVQELVRSTSVESNSDEFLVGPNDGVLGADLQTRLKAITEAGGAKLNLVQTLPPAHNGAIKYIGARIELLGTLAAIQRTIHAVESSKPYLFVGTAALKLSSTSVQPNAVGEPIIDAQLEVFGARQADEGPR